MDSITFVHNINASSNLEDSQLDETLYQGMEAIMMTTNLSITRNTMIKSRTVKRRFNDEVQIFIIPPVSKSDNDKLFYTEEEISNFRHEAFLEECGLSAEDFAEDVS